MIVKVILGTMQNARKLVSIAESIPCDVELCYGRYVVNAKSMLGVLSMPEFDGGELHVHTDNEKECEKILFQLLDQNLLVDTGDAVKRSIYDITTFGEILIDFTSRDINEDGQMLYARNPGGAPANVAVAASRLGAHTAFIGKAGKDMHGKFLKSVLEKENVDTKGMLLDENYFTTLAFVEVSETGERTFSFARKPGADTKIQKEEVQKQIPIGKTLGLPGSIERIGEDMFAVQAQRYLLSFGRIVVADIVRQIIFNPASFVIIGSSAFFSKFSPYLKAVKKKLTHIITDPVKVFDKFLKV